MDNKSIKDRDDNINFFIQHFDQIKPYRKYQFTIIFLVIFFGFMIYQLYNLNYLLNYALKTSYNLDQQKDDLDKNIKDLKAQTIKLNTNYYYLYNLDTTKSTDIIRTLKELTRMKSWINESNSLKFSLCYKATLHGDSGQNFRKKCKGLAPNIMLIETTDGYRFGAYISKPWMADNKYIYDENAFIFSLDTLRKYKVIKPERAAWDCLDKFPEYGENDIYLQEHFLSNGFSYSNFPRLYQKDSNAEHDYILTGGLKRFQVKEVEMLIVYTLSNE